MTGSDEGGRSGIAAGASGAGLMTAAQSRAARGLLDWSAADLAAKVGLGEEVVRGFEAGTADLASGQVEALRSALTSAGIVFGDDASSGVSLGRTGADEGTRLGALTTENDR